MVIWRWQLATKKIVWKRDCKEKSVMSQSLNVNCQMLFNLHRQAFWCPFVLVCVYSVCCMWKKGRLLKSDFLWMVVQKRALAQSRCHFSRAAVSLTTTLTLTISLSLSLGSKSSHGDGEGLETAGQASAGRKDSLPTWKSFICVQNAAPYPL